MLPEMSGPSSQDLHPKSGARFVFDRLETEPPSYSLAVYLPGDATLQARLDWNAEGQARLHPVDGPQTWTDWAHEEALKLARVLKRTPKSRLTRWRG